MRRWSAAVLAAALLNSASASAQQAPEAPRFTAETSAVVLDVVVRDGRGRPVLGLSRGDFEVFGASEQGADLVRCNVGVGGHHFRHVVIADANVERTGKPLEYPAIDVRHQIPESIDAQDLALKLGLAQQVTRRGTPAKLREEPSRSMQAFGRRA